MFVVGTPVSGSNFINRVDEYERLVREIEIRAKADGTVEFPHMELSAPRRIGKSSLLIETGERLKQEKYIPIYIQLLDIVKVEDFFIRLRDNVLENLPLTREVYEKFTAYISKIRINPFKLKPSYDGEQGFGVTFEDVVSLNGKTWQEIGRNTFILLRKYNNLKFVIFLDEMGFVRKVKDNDETRLEFLNILEHELSEPKTPTFVLCGSQNFFLILRNIKPEIYHLWRRKFLRIPIGCFDIDSTVNKLLIPNFKAEKAMSGPFFTEKILKSLSTFIYKITSGYPSISQMLGKEIAFQVLLALKKGKDIDNELLKSITLKAVDDCIIKDRQSFCNELLSEEALGGNHEEYKRLIYNVYSNESLSTNALYAGQDNYTMDTMLKDLEEQQYITLHGEKYTLSYNFLKYFLWHPRKDAKTWKEVEEEWNNCMK